MPGPTGVAAYTDTTATLVLLTLAAAAGFDRVFAGHSWIGPVLVVALGAHLVMWAARRARLHPAVSVLLGLAAVGLLAVWTLMPSTTQVGLPLGQTWDTMRNAVDQARSDFQSTLAPAPPTLGFKLLAVWGVGVVAVLADTAAFRWRSALQGSAPAFALFVACCILGRTWGRSWAIALLVLALVLFLYVHRVTVGRAGVVWFANRSPGSTGHAVFAAAVGGAVAVVAALAVVPAMPRTEGAGVLGWKDGPGGSGGQRQVTNPIVDLHTRLIQESQTPVFTVDSSVPSYWRLTSLDTFTGQQWISTNSYQGFGDRLPGAQSTPSGTRTVTEDFHIQQLDSVWLPAAFTPVSVKGVTRVSYDPVSGSLLTSRPTSNGLSYRVTSHQYLGTLNPAALRAAPVISNPKSLARYTALPASVPKAVRDLANKIVAGQRTEYDKALALQNYFVNTPLFTYNTNPPDDGYGINALTTFLFKTRQGYCQQFAGSYTVLARAIGLPTRLAVGYATGTSDGGTTYQVRDSDAHTWPEVWFPKYGWLPFEPTKYSTIPNAISYTGAQPAAPAATPVPTQLQRRNFGSATAGASNATSSATVAPATAGTQLGAGQGTSMTTVGIVVGALVAAVVLWMSSNVAVRRIRWRLRRRRMEPIAAAWEEAGELLAWWRVRRRADETHEELARRVAAQLGPRVQAAGATLPPLAPLARLMTEAEFAPNAPTAAGDRASAEVRDFAFALTQVASWRQRLTRLFDPALGWRHAPIDPPQVTPVGEQISREKVGAGR